MLTLIIVLLLVFWTFGLLGHIGGDFIHFLLLAVAVLLVFKLIRR